MNEEKLNRAEPFDDESQSSKDAKQRISYVSKDLKLMIEFIGKVYSQLGHAEYYSNKAIAAVNGLSSDSIKTHLSSAQQYKLLELRHRVGYRVTEHFQKLYLPRSESEKRAAILESLKNPETYRQLFRDYEYHFVPSDGVKNHFIRSFGLKEDAALRAAQVFMSNLKDFGLLDSRGVLVTAVTSKPIISEVKAEVDEPSGESKSKENEAGPQVNNHLDRPRGDKFIFQSELDAAGKKPVPIYLTDNKQALFLYPEDMTEDDVELIKHQIEGVLLRIKLERKKNQDINNKD